MPYLSGSLEAAGAVVDILIGVSQAKATLLKKHAFPVPSPIHTRALLDTGSFLSGFHPRVFQDLDLSAFDEIEITTPSTTGGGTFRVERYWVSLSLVAEGRVCPMPDCSVFATDSWRPGDGVEALIEWTSSASVTFNSWVRIADSLWPSECRWTTSPASITMPA